MFFFFGCNIYFVGMFFFLYDCHDKMQFFGSCFNCRMIQNILFQFQFLSSLFLFPLLMMVIVSFSNSSWIVTKVSISLLLLSNLSIWADRQSMMIIIITKDGPITVVVLIFCSFSLVSLSFFPIHAPFSSSAITIVSNTFLFKLLSCFAYEFWYILLSLDPFFLF